MFKISKHALGLSAIAATVLISSAPVLGADLGGSGNRRWSPRKAPGLFLSRPMGGSRGYRGLKRSRDARLMWKPIHHRSSVTSTGQRYRPG